jgi:hypothetical protein
MYSAPDCPVRYVDRPAVCADCLVIWSDRPVIYSDCPVLYADGLIGPFRVRTVRGGSSAGLSNLFLKTEPVAAAPDGPEMRRSIDLSLICVGGRGWPGYVFIGIP